MTDLGYNIVGVFLVFLIANLKCVSDLPKARALKNYKIVNKVNIFWRFVAVGNGWLWLTPCKRMKLRRSE